MTLRHHSAKEWALKYMFCCQFVPQEGLERGLMR